jgi:hypothetical protein
MSEVLLVRPSREDVLGLEVGDLALDCFQKYQKVTEIYGRGDDVSGRAYVCFYTDFGGGSQMSGSYKEGKLVRTVTLTNRYKSDECREIEKAPASFLKFSPAVIKQGGVK